MRILRPEPEPREVGLNIFLDDFGETCGHSHPQFPGNSCELTANHYQNTHMDSNGNEWIGMEAA